MSHAIGLRCTICGAEYDVHEVDYVCPKHGYDGILDVLYDYEEIRRRIAPEALTANSERSIWRYLPLLPVAEETARRLAEGTVLGSVGWTPLYPAPRLGARLGLRNLWVKDDGRQPTASYKDRASAIAVVKARERGRRWSRRPARGTPQPHWQDSAPLWASAPSSSYPVLHLRRKSPNSWPMGPRSFWWMEPTTRPLTSAWRRRKPSAGTTAIRPTTPICPKERRQGPTKSANNWPGRRTGLRLSGLRM